LLKDFLADKIDNMDLTTSNNLSLENSKITNIQIVLNNEAPRYAEIPFDTIPKEIIDSQSTDVDTVSGPTRTSNGIIEAVKNALSQAETNKSTESICH